MKLVVMVAPMFNIAKTLLFDQGFVGHGSIQCSWASDKFYRTASRTFRVVMASEQEKTAGHTHHTQDKKGCVCPSIQIRISRS